MSDRITLDTGNIKPNSHKYKSQELKRGPDTEKRTRQIVSSDQVVRTKKPLGKRLASDFFNADFKEVRDYAIKDKIMPGLKGWVLDILEMAFFDRPRDRRYDRGRDYYDDRPSYNYRASYRGRDYYDDRRRSDSMSRRSRKEERETDYQNVVLLDQKGAKDVVLEMRNMISKFGQASVADLFEMVGGTSRPIDNSWGWDREEDIGIRRVEDGFLIDVAPAKYLD